MSFNLLIYEIQENQKIFCATIYMSLPVATIWLMPLEEPQAGPGFQFLKIMSELNLTGPWQP